MKQRSGRRLVVLLLILAALAGISVAIAAVLGDGSAKESRTAGDVPRWIHEEQLSPTAVRGAELFAASGCTTCHTYAGTGRTNLDAPDLTAVGAHNLGIAVEVRHLKCPACVTPGSPMPAYASLGNTRLHQIAVFLEESKGIR